MVRPYGEAELHISVGQIQGQLEMMREENKRMLDDNRQLLRKLDEIGGRVVAVEHKIENVESKLQPIPDMMKAHDGRIIKLEQFDARIAGVVIFIGVVATTIGAGVWELIVNFSAVMNFMKRLFTGP